jgi:hypothetical protein
LQKTQAKNAKSSADSKNDYKPKVWVSKKAPGTPAIAEMVFECILQGKTDSRAFHHARAHYKSLTDAQLWICYEEWAQGRVHALIKRGEQANEYF